jgi:predicted nuclease of predicted toxin-antitoxin system
MMLSTKVADGLRGASHDAVHMRAYGLECALDEEMPARAAHEQHVLI